MPENRGRDIKGGLDPTTCLNLYEHHSSCDQID